MAYKHEYPYTDAGRYNSDWLLNKMKDLLVQWADLDERFDTQVEDTVRKQLADWDEDGTLDRIINEEVFGELDGRVTENTNNINSITSQVNTNTVDLNLIKTKVFYATPEQFGAVGDGVNDDTSAIQQAVDSNAIVLFSRTYMITDHINIRSNNRLIGFNAIIKDNTTELTENYLFSCDTINNFHISGIYFNTTGFRYGIRAIMCNNFMISKCAFQTNRFGIYMYGINNFTISDIYINQIRTDSSTSRDGIHINGFAHSGYITNIKGTSDDDLIALNADDSFATGSGTIENIIINGIICDNIQQNKQTAHSIIRILSYGSYINDIYISNINGLADYTSCIQIGNNDGGTSNIGRIVFSNCIIGVDSVGLSQYPPVLINGNANDIQFIDCEFINNRTNLNMERGIVQVENGTVINTLSIRNSRWKNVIGISNITINGTVNKLMVRDIDLTESYYNNSIWITGSVGEMLVDNMMIIDKRYPILIAGSVNRIFIDNINHTMTSTNSISILRITGNVTEILCGNIILDGEGQIIEVTNTQTGLSISILSHRLINNTFAGNANVRLTNADIGMVRYVTGVRTITEPSFAIAGDKYILLGNPSVDKFYNGSSWN